MDRKIQLDKFDFAIIEALQQNGRVSISELGRSIGLSQPAVSERVKRLETNGVIQGYTARVDPSVLGIAMMAIVRLRTTHEHIQDCLRQFRNTPHIIDAHRVTGEDCFVLKVAVATPACLESVVDALARYGSVTTAVVLRSEPSKPFGRELLMASGT